jgi:ubiquitin carboxyl-terminal hydrolase 7
VENQPVDDHIGKFTWTVANFAKISVRKHYSDPFVVGGYKWYGFKDIKIFVTVTLAANCWFLSVEQLLSNEELVVFGCRRVLLFPRGNNVDQLSLYLDVADSTQLPNGWTRFAHFNLAVVNHYEPKMSVRKGAGACSCFCGS